MLAAGGQQKNKMPTTLHQQRYKKSNVVTKMNSGTWTAGRHRGGKKSPFVNPWMSFPKKFSKMHYFIDEWILFVGTLI